MPETQNNNIEERSMLPVGTLLQGGKYRIDRYLSSGGFGNTYVATNLKFEEQVAIKEFFMRGISQRDDDSLSVSVSNETNVQQFTSQRDKFRKEARRLRRLHNEHIVAVHDLFDENGTAYYEMDLIKGESLSERLKRTGQPLDESEVMTILEQVLDALAVVHAQGLYHLDLKPANIMIDKNGRALLIDFGASKQLSTGEGYSVSTSSALAYTPGYAPLEQIDQNIKCFGPWTDIYALGATLYKLLTNLTPPSPSELISSRSTLNFPVPVSPCMQELITWMMKPAYEERPQSVADVKKFLDGKVIEEETELEIGQNSPSELTLSNKKDKPLSFLEDKTQIINSIDQPQIINDKHLSNDYQMTGENKNIKQKVNKKNRIYGIILGIIILGITCTFIFTSIHGRKDTLLDNKQIATDDSISRCDIKKKTKLEIELENCSYERTQICDDEYTLCYYVTYPSFLSRSYPSDDNDFKNVFTKDDDMKIETWELWNHIEVDYDCNDVYNLLKLGTDTYHSVKKKEIITAGQYSNGMKYYTKAVFNKEDDVIYGRLIYTDSLSSNVERELIKQVFDNFPN